MSGLWGSLYLAWWLCLRGALCLPLDYVVLNRKVRWCCRASTSEYQECIPADGFQLWKVGTHVRNRSIHAASQHVCGWRNVRSSRGPRPTESSHGMVAAYAGQLTKRQIWTPSAPTFPTYRTAHKWSFIGINGPHFNIYLQQLPCHNSYRVVTWNWMIVIVMRSFFRMYLHSSRVFLTPRGWTCFSQFFNKTKHLMSNVYLMQTPIAHTNAIGHDRQCFSTRLPPADL